MYINTHTSSLAQDDITDSIQSQICPCCSGLGWAHVYYEHLHQLVVAGVVRALLPRGTNR